MKLKLDANQELCFGNSDIKAGRADVISVWLSMLLNCITYAQQSAGPTFSAVKPWKPQRLKTSWCDLCKKCPAFREAIRDCKWSSARH